MFLENSRAGKLIEFDESEPGCKYHDIIAISDLPGAPTPYIVKKSDEDDFAAKYDLSFFTSSPLATYVSSSVARDLLSETTITHIAVSFEDIPRLVAIKYGNGWHQSTS